MLVFLSWSGNRSRLLAEAFAKWLGQVIQAVEPWISVDIEKGARWGPEIAEKLEKSKIGIICLTPENLESRWILFEAGALSKTKDAYVCTLLLNLTPADVEPPLGQFQHTIADKSDISRLVRTVNAAVLRLGERGLSEVVMTDVFETFWPQFDARLTEIASIEMPSKPPTRSQSDILDEILSTVRNLERRQATAAAESSWRPWRVSSGAQIIAERKARPLTPLGPEEQAMIREYVAKVTAGSRAKPDETSEAEVPNVPIDGAS